MDLQDDLELNTILVINAVRNHIKQAVLNGLMVQELEEQLPLVNAVMEVNEVYDDDVIEPNIENLEMVDVDLVNINLMNVPQKVMAFLNGLKIPIGKEVMNSEPEDVEDANPASEDVEMDTQVEIAEDKTESTGMQLVEITPLQKRSNKTKLSQKQGLIII